MYRDEHDAAVLRAQALYEEAVELGLEDTSPVVESASTLALVSNNERLERDVWRKRTALLVAKSLAERTKANAASEPNASVNVVPRASQVPEPRDQSALSALGGALAGLVVRPALMFFGVLAVATVLAMLESLIEWFRR